MTRSQTLAWMPLFLTLMATPLSAAVIHVPGDQPDIQAGINAAVDGDTVLVGPGTYYDPINFIGKEIILRSTAGPEQTRIDGTHHDRRAVTFNSGEGPGAVISGFTITNALGGGIYCRDSSPSISDNIITTNGYGYYYYAPPTGNGGGIASYGGHPYISGNSIINNRTPYDGGGIFADSQATIINNWIFGNDAFSRYWENFGGGIYAGSEAIIIGNVLEDNRAVSLESLALGGGIYGGGLIEGNIFIDNHSDVYGDGIYICSGIVRNNIFIDDRVDCWNRWTGGGPREILLEGNIMTGLYSSNSEHIEIRNCIITGEITIEEQGSINLSYSNVLGGEAAVTSIPPATYDWGPGMISADPLFISGPLGDHYLSQVAAGQAVDSPCIDAGDPITEFAIGVTRTDGYPDSDVIDMGYHYSALGIVVGPGPSELNPPRIRIMSLGEYSRPILDSNAYGASGYGVNVVLGDPDGDQVLEILTGPGPGDIYGPHVRGFETDGTPIADLSFMAYGTNKYGVNITTGDLNGNGRDEIITGAGPGAVFGPHVRAFSYTPGSGVSTMPGINFFAYSTHKWGVNVTAGDVDGDGYDEIITGAGPGPVFGPHVRGWNVDGGTAAVIPNMGFLAYGTNRFGVNVCCADVNGDGVDEIVTGPGPTGFFPSHVRGWRWDGTETTPLPGYSFFAWSPDEALFGARVGRAADMDHDGCDELVVGAGPDPDVGTPVKVFRYADDQITEWFAFEAFPAGWSHGANAAGGLMR